MIILILFIALILRSINLSQSLWLDEAINVNNVVNLGFSELFYKYSLGDFHPPLYHLILKLNTNLLGSSEVAVRLPSVIFGVLTVFVIYLIGRKLFENKTALIAATLLATSPLHIYYSQEARMYSLAALLTSISIYYFVLLTRQSNLRNWMGFIIATTLTLYSDYLPYTLLPVFIVAIYIQRRIYSKKSITNFIPAFLLITILLIPWLIVFPSQLEVGLSAAAASPAWANVVGSTDIKNVILSFVKFSVGRISLDNNLLYALTFLPVALFVSWMFFISFFRTSTHRFIIWFWFFIPLVSGYIVSFVVPVFAFFRYIFILPAFYLIIAAGINSISSQKYVRGLLLIAISINLLSVSLYLLNPKFQREDWKQATKYIHTKSTTNSIVLFEQGQSIAPFDYYNKGRVNSYGALNGFSADEVEIRDRLSDLTSDINKIFLFQYLSGITDPQGILFREISNAGFTNISTKDFAGVGFVYEFQRVNMVVPDKVIR